MRKEEIAKMIDHTFLKAYATKDDMMKLCDEAKRFNTAMVAINPSWVRFCKELLKDTSVHVGAAIGFPLGQTPIEVKAYETKKAIEDGADEIDYVINISALKDNDLAYIEKEMQTIVDICKAKNVISKVIFENCYLEDEEKITLCKIANICHPDYIKTSTGFGTGGATIEDVILMRRYADQSIAIKAAGGIKTFADFKKFYENGATRIGTSSTLKIIEEYENGIE